MCLKNLTTKQKNTLKVQSELYDKDFALYKMHFNVAPDDVNILVVTTKVSI